MRPPRKPIIRFERLSTTMSPCRKSSGVYNSYPDQATLAARTIRLNPRWKSLRMISIYAERHDLAEETFQVGNTAEYNECLSDAQYAFLNCQGELVPLDNLKCTAPEARFATCQGPCAVLPGERWSWHR